MVDHADFVSPTRVHESKQILGATTSDAGKVITPSSSSNGVGVLRKLTLSELDTSTAAPWTGWEHLADSTYTSGSPLSVLDGVRTKVTIDGLGSATNKDYLPSGVTGFWDVAENQFDPVAEGDCYDVRLQFKCATTPTNAFVDCELDIGGALGVILRETRPLLRAASATNIVVFSWPVFTLDTFLANGGEFYITPNEDATFWDFAITIIRTHNGG